MLLYQRIDDSFCLHAARGAGNKPLSKQFKEVGNSVSYEDYRCNGKKQTAI